MTDLVLRGMYPFRVRILKENPYDLPVGKVFPFARRRDGEASPFPIVVRGNCPEFFNDREYQMREDEVEMRESLEEGEPS